MAQNLENGRNSLNSFVRGCTVNYNLSTLGGGWEVGRRGKEHLICASKAVRDMNYKIIKYWI